MVVETAKETLGFQAEVKQLLNLVVNSLYSNKEIFLRELISNATDAIEKLRYLALTQASLYENDPDLKIVVKKDKKAGTLTIRDNGIGMTRQEVIENLGTIANSGTRKFMASLTGDQARDSQLIGQFGVGFYSAFIVAEKVVVLTRKAGESAENGVRWESEGVGEYTLENITLPKRGTELILYFKKDELALLEEWQIRSIIQKYSDHISVPIEMEVEVYQEAKEDDAKESEPKTELKMETINSGKALWTRHKNDITDQQYQEFYKQLTHDYEGPMSWSLNRVEGKTEYVMLLYIPSHAPFDMWNRETPRGLKLYVRRVFILDNADQFLPLYLRFFKGIVDSSDLPLNVSREILQSDKLIESMRSGVTKRALAMIEKLAEDADKYQKFWKVFGQVLKEGPVEDFANREQIAKLLRFASTHHNGPEQTVSFTDYISRMKSDQDKIYYVVADNFNAAKNSPHLEIFRKKGIEVLLMSDRVDEWMVAHLSEVEGKKLQAITKGDIDIGESEEDKKIQEKQKEDFAATLKQIKENLGARVKAVRLTNRLTESPSCVVTEEGDMSPHMLRVLEAAGQEVPSVAPVLELNPEHQLVQRLHHESDDERFAAWSEVLFAQAILSEGGSLSDPALFVNKLNQLLM